MSYRLRRRAEMFLRPPSWISNRLRLFHERRARYICSLTYMGIEADAFRYSGGYRVMDHETLEGRCSGRRADEMTAPQVVSCPAVLRGVYTWGCGPILAGTISEGIMSLKSSCVYYIVFCMVVLSDCIYLKWFRLLFHIPSSLLCIENNSLDSKIFL